MRTQQDCLSAAPNQFDLSKLPFIDIKSLFEYLLQKNDELQKRLAKIESIILCDE